MCLIMANKNKNDTEVKNNDLEFEFRDSLNHNILLQ